MKNSYKTLLKNNYNNPIKVLEKVKIDTKNVIILLAVTRHWGVANALHTPWHMCKTVNS